MALTYAVTARTIELIYRTTSGGTVFSADLDGTAVFDYFDDAAVVDDALYFAVKIDASRFDFNVGTAMAGTGIEVVWEFYQRDLTAYGGSAEGWEPLPTFEDDTAGFTVTGAGALKFGMPYGWMRTTVNGGNFLWLRCRISALTTITEGGANQTSAVTAKDADVNVDGYSDVSPCTLTLIDDYLNTNAPWLAQRKSHNFDGMPVFDFREVSLDINSRLLSLNETLIIGMYGTTNGYAGYYDLRNLQMGELLDGKDPNVDWATEDFAQNGSTLIVHVPTNQYQVLTTSGAMRVFGSRVLSPYGFGYPNWYAKCVDSYFEGVSFYFGNNGSFRNCRMMTYAWLSIYGFPPIFAKNKVLIRDGGSHAFMICYNYGFVVEDLDWANASAAPSGQMFYFNNSYPNDDTEYIMKNWVREPPLTTDPTYNLFRAAGQSSTSYQTCEKVFFYDDSAGTYTDYTAEAAGTAVGDVPVHGDVGDCIYMAEQGGSTNGYFHGFYTSLVSNDYDYAYEKYDASAGGWIEMDTDWMNSTGKGAAGWFTVTFTTANGNGRIWQHRDASVGWADKQTINGYNAYWTRLRIITKGTGTPMIDKIVTDGENGMGKWNAYVRYTLDLSVWGPGEVGISGAAVTIKQAGAEVYSGVTDGSGAMTPQDLDHRHIYYDPVNYWSAINKCADDELDAYEVTVSKSGYRTERLMVKMNGRKAMEVTLQPVLSNNQHSSVRLAASRAVERIPNPANLPSLELWLDAGRGIPDAVDATMTDWEDQSPTSSPSTLLAGKLTRRASPARVEFASGQLPLKSIASMGADTTWFFVIDTTTTDLILLSAASGYLGCALEGNTVNGVDYLMGTISYYVNGTLLVAPTRDDLYNAFSTGSKLVVSVTGADMSSVGVPYLLGYNHVSAYHFVGDAYDIIGCDAALTEGERQDVEAFLMAKHGITP